MDLLTMFNIEKKEETKVETKVEKKKENNSKKTETKTKKVTKKLDNLNANKEKELKNFTKVELKAFGGRIKMIEGEELENIKLDTLQGELVELGYHEFAANVLWLIVPNKTNTEAVLVASCGEKFHAKG